MRSGRSGALGSCNDGPSSGCTIASVSLKLPNSSSVLEVLPSGNNEGRDGALESEKVSSETFRTDSGGIVFSSFEVATSTIAHDAPNSSFVRGSTNKTFT